MRSGLATTILAAVVLFTAAGAQAGGILATAPASEGFSGARLYCDAVNVGTTDVVISIEVRSYAGVIQNTPSDITLLPNKGTSASSGGTDAGAWCKFVIVRGSPKKVRGLAVYADEATSKYLAGVSAH